MLITSNLELQNLFDKSTFTINVPYFSEKGVDYSRNSITFYAVVLNKPIKIDTGERNTTNTGVKGDYLCWNKKKEIFFIRNKDAFHSIYGNPAKNIKENNPIKRLINNFTK